MFSNSKFKTENSFRPFPLPQCFILQSPETTLRSLRLSLGRVQPNHPFESNVPTETPHLEFRLYSPARCNVLTPPRPARAVLQSRHRATHSGCRFLPEFPESPEPALRPRQPPMEPSLHSSMLLRFCFLDPHVLLL